MKPDWKDAPEWANYLAMDKTREWFWYRKEPSLNEEGGFWDITSNQFEPADLPEDEAGGWMETLETRPE